MVKIESPWLKTLWLLLVAGARSASSPFILLLAAVQLMGMVTTGPAFVPIPPKIHHLVRTAIKEVGAPKLGTLCESL